MSSPIRHAGSKGAAVARAAAAPESARIDAKAMAAAQDVLTKAGSKRSSDGATSTRGKHARGVRFIQAGSKRACSGDHKTDKRARAIEESRFVKIDHRDPKGVILHDNLFDMFVFLHPKDAANLSFMFRDMPPYVVKELYLKAESLRIATISRTFFEILKECEPKAIEDKRQLHSAKDKARFFAYHLRKYSEQSLLRLKKTEEEIVEIIKLTLPLLSVKHLEALSSDMFSSISHELKESIKETLSLRKFEELRLF